VGIWNLLIKFWSDDWYNSLYENVTAKLEWGILKLLNFDFKVSRKERILMEAKIRSISSLAE
jgi:hypothetical protein